MLVKFGGVAVDGRGSIAGNTFSKNRYGNYVRARTTPVNPKSDRQSAIRAIVANVSSRWSSVLTVAQRAAWSVFAAAIPAKNKLGEVIYLSGYNQFCKSNIAAVNAGNAIIIAAPTVLELPGEDTSFAATVDSGTGLISIAFDDARDWLDEVGASLIVEMGLPKAAGVNFFGGPWRSAGAIAGNDTTPPTSPDTSLTAPFTTGVGQKVWVRAKIQRADGRLSDWFRNSTIVGAA